MHKENPDHHDAEIILKLYELRREATMREARNSIIAKFWPKSYEDFIAITDMQHPMNAAFRQTSSYWEMAYGFAKHGVVNPDLLMESSGEGLFLFAKVRPYLERWRKEASPTAFSNTEWICNNSQVAKQRLTMIETRVKQMMEKMG